MTSELNKEKEKSKEKHYDDVTSSDRKDKEQSSKNVENEKVNNLEQIKTQKNY